MALRVLLLQSLSPVTMYDKPRKILILEDDPIIAHDLAIILQQNGDYIHPICHSAHDAYDLIGKHEIDLAILDINLGSGPSGIDVATIINEKKLFPYIFLTSYSCLLYTSPSPRDATLSRMPSSA